MVYRIDGAADNRRELCLSGLSGKFTQLLVSERFLKRGVGDGVAAGPR
jgi:hypothetical protein